MRLFHDKGFQAENERLILPKIISFLKTIREDKILKKYVRVFGITGPAARGQASSKGSDIDFCCITKYLNPFHERHLNKKFKECFAESKIEASILIFGPSIFKKPDLMFFEFVNSGKILYGSIKRKLSIADIPKWEGIRVLCLKGNPFIVYQKSPSKEFDYYYTKLLFGIGEALLLLDSEYVTDDFERYNLVLKNRHAKKIPVFLEQYRLAQKFRYSDYSFRASQAEKKKRKEKGLLFSRYAWKVFLEEYFDCSYEESLEKLRRIKPAKFKERVGTRLFYTVKYMQFFKKIRFCIIQEPFIREILTIQKYLAKPDEKLRKKIIESWFAAPKFWYKK
ncbi:MAG: hypothetical protein V1659_05905 [Candidatus Woesearchaeota archaeon]